MNNPTTPEQYIERFKELTTKMLEITKKKNKDYSGDKTAFKNFEMIEFARDGKTTTKEWFLVRMWDKFTRLCNLIDKEAAVEDEKIEDTILDLANYCLLLRIYIETDEQECLEVGQKLDLDNDLLNISI